jgi:hypothetical protein
MVGSVVRWPNGLWQGPQHICPPAGESELPAQDRGLTATDVKPLLLATVRHTTRSGHWIGRGPHAAAAAAAHSQGLVHRPRVMCDRCALILARNHFPDQPAGGEPVPQGCDKEEIPWQGAGLRHPMVGMQRDWSQRWQQQQSYTVPLSGVAVPKHPAQPLGVQAQRCAHCYQAAATCSGLHGVLTTAHSEQRRLLHCYCSHRDTHSIWHAMLAFPKCHTRIQRVNLFCEWLCVVVSCRNSHGYEVATRWRAKFTHVSTFIPPGCDTLVVRHCLLARQCQA